ncbi:BrnT family toxin [Allofranklinella schreckenbergeri]|uniref:BrnT family toxin n=1 Tax=Allofranklinella schreckenbergeri TaxID=1076744 RepID=A0A3M6Q8J7_9BURK|nr:BrnT family toxin [Allofranklinella schreckenbergeri]RMW99246.1 BrnT family toxin [Allofranklinella schreckenbergeri]
MDRFFEWDSNKAKANFRKHGIHFEEAARVFDDPLALTVQDRIENAELRWQTIGMVGGCLVLLVAHTVRLDDEGIEIVRIISARRADRAERKRYEHG